MNRREFIGATAVVPITGCTGWIRPGRECPEIESITAEMTCRNDGPLSLTIEPSEIEIPATVTFTIVNEDHREWYFRVTQPYVYRRTDSGWKSDRYFRWREMTERVPVNDQYSFEKEIPIGLWDPDAGEYLLLIDGIVESDEEIESVLLGEFIEIRE